VDFWACIFVASIKNLTEDALVQGWRQTLFKENDALND
jgi:hypothetical protein